MRDISDIAGSGWWPATGTVRFLPRVQAVRGGYSGRANSILDVAPRVLALLGAAALIASFLVVFRDLVDTVGDPSSLWLLVAISLVAATLCSRVLRVWSAILLASLSLLVGLAWYLFTLPHDPLWMEVVDENLQLLTGQSLYVIERVDRWALGVAPVPVFVTWYLALRRWYGTAALVGGTMLSYFVLTGDAGTTLTLSGVVAGAALVGFGDLDGQTPSPAALEFLAIALAVMVIAPALVTVVPGGAASPITILDDETTTMEENLITDEERFGITGSVSQSPKVRFTVSSDEPRYWRTTSYDRYTGVGWVQSTYAETGDERSLSSPPGESRTVDQEFEVETAVTTLPAAWQPQQVTVPGGRDVIVRGNDAMTLSEPLQPGDGYRVRSEVPTATAGELATAGTDYPGGIKETYTQLPSSTPDRVGERTAAIIEPANNPYDSAVLTEEWLRANRNYSLDVERPEGDVADAFLFEMEAGYCTYYATTMVAMLRSQEIPARMAVGYTAGEQVEGDRYVVRGLNSHAWVEVYFPEHGWVTFEPTPPSPREAAESTAIEDAREAAEPGVDTNETHEEFEADATNGTDVRPEKEAPETEPELEDVETEDPEHATQTDSDDGLTLPGLPPRDQLLLGLVALLGLGVGVRRYGMSGLPGRLLGSTDLTRAEPAVEVEKRFERLCAELERRHRSRRRGETVSDYLDAIDAEPHALGIAHIRERARYGPAPTDQDVREVREALARFEDSEAEAPGEFTSTR